MGVLIDGTWRDEELPQKPARAGEFRRADSRLPRSHHGRRLVGLQGRGRALSPLCRPWLPVGASHADLSRAQEARAARSRVAYAIPGIKEQGWTFEDNPAFPDCTPDTRQWLPLSARGLYGERPALHRQGHGADAVGQEDPAHRQQRVVRNHPHAQQRVQAASPATTPTIIRRRCAARSTASTTSSTPTSTTASIAAASRARRQPTRRPTTRCLRRSTSSKRGSDGSAIWSATRSPRPTGGCSRRWCGSTSPISRCSSATASASPIIPNLSNYMRELYQVPGIAATVKPRHYVINYWSISAVNPTGIIPKGTPVDYRGRTTARGLRRRLCGHR